MDDITHGQWNKNHYNSNNNNNDDDGSMEYYHTDPSIPNDDILDPYTMQKSFRKMAKKLSRRL
jgi:hypothetical protein